MAEIFSQPEHDACQASARLLRERLRQVKEEGWTPAHDDAHAHGELAFAAACYALSGTGFRLQSYVFRTIEELWPWARAWWKPKDRTRDLERAGALIIAELERLERQRRPVIDGDSWLEGAGDGASAA